jgi:hypothetical protein
VCATTRYDAACGGAVETARPRRGGDPQALGHQQYHATANPDPGVLGLVTQLLQPALPWPVEPQPCEHRETSCAPVQIGEAQ